jgi:hypothetical protein
MIIHVRNEDLETSSFTANPAFTQESGASMELEDGTTVLEWDGSVSWTVEVIHARSKDQIAHVKQGVALSSRSIEITYDRITEDGETRITEDGETRLTQDAETFSIPLFHAR